MSRVSQVARFADVLMLCIQLWYTPFVFWRGNSETTRLNQGADSDVRTIRLLIAVGAYARNGRLAVIPLHTTHYFAIL